MLIKYCAFHISDEGGYNLGTEHTAQIRNKNSRRGKNSLGNQQVLSKKEEQL